MNIAQTRTAFNSLAHDLRYIVTATLFPLALDAALWLITPSCVRSHPLALSWFLFLWWSVVWAWAYKRSWDREHEIANKYQDECANIYAEVLLTYFLKQCVVLGNLIRASQSSLATELRLSENQITSGLENLAARQFVEHTVTGEWAFNRAKIPAGHFGGFERKNQS